jgi:deoxyadenosine/deoxycytidine kinase
MSKKWYIIEGNIGSGKSTLLNILNEMKNVEIVQEPVDKWLELKDTNNVNLLQHFYQDMERNSYLFQTMVFKTRVEALDKPQIENIRFSERSIWTDRFVFGRMCLEDNKMNSIESECYKHWFQFLESKFKPKPDGIIYIKSSPEKCLERISNRGRGEEDKIKLEYLQRLDTLHNEWFKNWKETPVLILDNDKDNNWVEIIDKIKFLIKGEDNDVGYSYFGV